MSCFGISLEGVVMKIEAKHGEVTLSPGELLALARELRECWAELRECWATIGRLERDLELAKQDWTS